MKALPVLFLALLLTSISGLPRYDGTYSGLAHAACSDPAGPGVDWSECRKRNLIISGQDFSGANLSRVDFSSSDLREVNLENADVSKANLFRASLKGARGINANLSNTVAARTDLSGADFTGADFSKAETTRVDFSNTSLDQADLSKGEFPRAVFTGADVSGVIFNNSNLARADFRGVRFGSSPSFTDAYLYQTRFEGVDLSAVSDLAQWQIDLSCGDETTVLPDNVAVPASWPCPEEE